MKRFVTIAICFVLFGYFMVLLGGTNFLGIKKVPYIGSVLREVGKFCGMGALFTRETTMHTYLTKYRFYQQGRWEPWQELEKPLFEAYFFKANFASLKHGRLDRRLSQRMHSIAQLKGVIEMKKSHEFSNFTAHLFLRHNCNRQPDSLTVQYTKLGRKGQEDKTLLVFTYKP